MATKRRGKIDEGKRAPRILGRRDFIGATGLAVTATLGRGVSASVPGQAARPTQPEGMDDDSSGGSKWGAHLKRTPFSLNEPNVPSRILWIGTLQGTWKEMGIQYGQRAAKDITQHWDHDWEDRVIDNRGFWAKSRTPEARQAWRTSNARGRNYRSSARS
jgi:hypothetical protein